MTALAKFRQPIDDFFEKVVVNDADKEVRRNRLLLLSEFREILNRIADFSKIE